MTKWDPKRWRGRETKRHENRVADHIGGQRRAGSGSFANSSWTAPFERSKIFGSGRKASEAFDIFSDRFVGEHKRTGGDRYGVQPGMLRDLTDRAEERSRLPLLVITFTNGHREAEDWCALRHQDLALVFDGSHVDGVPTFVPIQFQSSAGGSIGVTRSRCARAKKIAALAEDDRTPSLVLVFEPAPIALVNVPPWIVFPYPVLYERVGEAA